MAYKNLCKFIDKLEETGELVKIKTFADPFLEISEITDRISKSHGPALLFENTGYNFLVLINAFGSEKRMCLAFGIAKFDDFAVETLDLLKDFSCQESLFPTS